MKISKAILKLWQFFTSYEYLAKLLTPRFLMTLWNDSFTCCFVKIRFLRRRWLLPFDHKLPLGFRDHFCFLRGSESIDIFKRFKNFKKRNFERKNLDKKFFNVYVQEERQHVVFVFALQCLLRVLWTVFVDICGLKYSWNWGKFYVWVNLTNLSLLQRLLNYLKSVVD